MNWTDWKKEYHKIIEQLGLDFKADEQSAQLFEKYLATLPPTRKTLILQKLTSVFQRPVIIAGAGPSLERDLTALISFNIMNDLQMVAIDGATTLFRDENIVPVIVITDLDGDLNAILWAIKRGALTLIHAHGDNQQRVSLFIDQQYELIIKNNVWGTTQSGPGVNLLNFGGFTDGDRGIFLAIHFQSPCIGLIGFDFGTRIGKYSTLNSPVKKSERIKIEKFRIALNLIASYYSQHKGQRFNLTSQGQQISGFPKMDISSFLNDWRLMCKKHDNGVFPKL